MIKWDQWSDGQGWKSESRDNGGAGGQQSGADGTTDNNPGKDQSHPSHSDNEQREGAGSSRQGDENRERQNPEQEYVPRTRSGGEPHRDSHGDQNEPKNRD